MTAAKAQSEKTRTPPLSTEGKWARRRRMAVAWALLPVAVLPGVWVAWLDNSLGSESFDSTDSDRTVAMNALSGGAPAVVFVVVLATMAMFLGRSRALTIVAALSILSIVVLIPWAAVTGMHD